MSAALGYLTRSTGVVATILVVAALAWGFFFSARATGNRLRPNWWLDLHNWLGGLALTFTGVHILASWLDSSSGVGLPQIFIPGTAASGWAMSWGVLGAYLFAVVVFTSWPRRWKRRSWWRVIHLTSVAGTVFAFLHAYQLGSDVTRVSFQVGFIAAAAAATYALGIRLFGLTGEKRGET